jgi:ATP-dependent DNA helicase RecG
MEDPAQKIEKIIRLECAKGYKDDAVTCGLEEFVKRSLPQAKSLVAGYKEASPFERQRAVSRLLEYLLHGEVSEVPQKDPELLSQPVEKAKGVGEKRAAKLNKLGIITIEDLLTYFPRRLEDRSRFSPMGRLSRGEEVGVRGEILAVDQIYVNRRMRIVKVAVGDGSGIIYAVWFNQPWLAQQLQRGEKIDLYGKVEQAYGQLQMRSPAWEPAGEGQETGRIVPIYPATEGISDRVLRSLIRRNLYIYGSAFVQLLPDPIINKYNLLYKREAVCTIHSPPDQEQFERARRSLAFDEMWLLQLGMLKLRGQSKGIVHTGSGQLANSFLASLPFRLTSSQQGALTELIRALGSEERMVKLLQGDVGTGKTIVALTAALHVVEAGYQVAFMVPTEILAEQHAARLGHRLAGLPVKVELLTGVNRAKDRLKEQLLNGEIDIVVGTHALIQQDVNFASLGLVVIDEQHRFGVVQRSVLEEKGENIDLLVMSATPIPRTIALTLYGGFDISLIEGLPMGERRVTTVWVGEKGRQQVYEDVRRRLAAGGKGYVVLPLIEESERSDLKAAVQVVEELNARLPEFEVGLLHGRMNEEERNDALRGFRSGKIRLLVTTTVIEVGIDVGDADLMVIEHADRFGLSQLHQLRGRIGRSAQPAICFAISTANTEQAKRRLTAFAKYTDGFSIAEEDLLIRGPGDMLGTRQHGFLSRLRAIDLLRDYEIINAARDEARAMLTQGLPAAVTAELDRRFGDMLSLMHV